MVKLIESFVIKPAGHTPNGLMSLSDFDQVAAITHAPIVYFYQGPIDFDSFIFTLKDSLAKVLVPFYPLAGRLRSIGEGRFEVDYDPIGAQFLVAESEATIEYFGDFHPTPELRALVPLVDSKAPLHEQPLLLVQVTKLSCGGICLGMAVSHIMVDGPGGSHFTIEWARIARGEQLSNPPFLDRTVLQVNDPLLPPGFDHPEYSSPPLLVGRLDAMEERMKKTMMFTLKLTKKEVDTLKDKANNGRNNINARSYSRFEAVGGHMWRSACKARRHVSQQTTRLYFPMDVRNRIEPPLPKFYFGNAMCRAAATSTSGEILSNPLSYASSKIREAVDKATDEYLRSSMRLVKNLQDVSQYRNFHSPGCTQGAFHGNPNMAINSWTRLPMYGADFGWGKEIYIGPAALGSEGKSVIIHSSQEDDSFDIVLNLQVAHMEDFKKFFYDDI
uniref:Hydroxcinnamoyl-CoA quinate/shikimate hydroxycinnamoyl transferase 2 n=1 Tax=Lonicera hypoglauca TaxID=638626 RepID=A0A0U2D8T5_9DIPS|nr:hydroxcinnamoyl-CoA quinate/shikimate hydroxycinnamoyl transferase 2 [Lonicera hypoglauca]